MHQPRDAEEGVTAHPWIRPWTVKRKPSSRAQVVIDLEQTETLKSKTELWFVGS